MNILEFIASIEALPPQVMDFAREKSALASRFGLMDSPATLPYDIQQTRIPDRALDGYIAKHVLSQPGISDESFADYAFTASAIFAALQLSIRSGYHTRLLDIEYPHFIFGSLSPCISRIVGALDDIPMSLSYRGEAPNSAKQNSIWDSLRRLAEQRTAMRPSVEQVLTLIEPPHTGGLNDGKPANEFLGQVPTTQGKIGLLVMSGLLDADNYIQAFDSLQSRLSEVAVVLIYARRAILDECCSVLVSRHIWRGVVVKHLAYQKELLATDFALLALQANFYNCEEAHRAVDFS